MPAGGPAQYYDAVGIAASAAIVVESTTMRQPKVPHTFSNPFDEPATMFCIMTPDTYVPYFRDLKALQKVGLNGPAIHKIMADYATEPA